MLPIHIKSGTLFDEKTFEFIHVKDTNLKLEHSLISVSKWETEWKIPFLTDKEKTKQQLDDYIRCMSISGDIDPNAIKLISQDDRIRISNYIGDKKTATWFSNTDDHKSKSSEQVTSELIYYWMIAYHIPPEYEKWHLSRLLTLIEICERKNAPAKKMSESEIIARNKALNAQRRAQLHSKG